MKTKVLFFSLLLLCMTGCKNDDNEPENKSVEKELIGTWKLSKVIAFGNDFTNSVEQIKPCLLETTLTFTNQTEFTANVPCEEIGTDMNGTYVVQNDSVTLISSLATVGFQCQADSLISTMRIKPSDFKFPLPEETIVVTVGFVKEH